MAQQRDPRRKGAGNEVDIVEFQLGKQSFGINVSKVKEFFPYQPERVTKLPQSPPAVVGVFVLRDKTIPLVDLNAYLQRPAHEVTGQQVVIVTEFNRRMDGFIVDSINKIHRLSWDKFEPLSDYLGEYQPQMIGSINVDKKEIFVLDLEHILGEVSPETMEAYDQEEGQGEVDDKTRAKRSAAKLIMADDSSVIRKHLTAKLNRVGYSQVNFYKNGREAWAAIEAVMQTAAKGSEPVSRLLTGVVTDIEMPAMDGLSLCRKVKAEPKLAEVPVIMFSSLINQHMANKCRNAGADAHTAKPAMADLIDLMDEQLLPRV